MNVIFLDFDGVLNTYNMRVAPLEEEGAEENRFKILGNICKLYNCKVVISSAHKDAIDEETLETNLEWIQEYFNLFKKYGIEVIGRTPTLERTPGKPYEHYISPFWKEEEIILYLKAHPEIEHFCVIDDDDAVTIPAREQGDFSKSDLNLVRDYLITTDPYSDTDPSVTGLLESHIEEVGKILQKENRFKKTNIR